MRLNQPAMRLNLGLVLYPGVFGAKGVTVARKRLVHLWQNRGHGNPQHALYGQHSCERLQKLGAHGGIVRS